MKNKILNNRYRKTTNGFWLFVVVLILSFQLQAQSSREYNIKAVFLYNFTQFVDWPPSAFSNAESPFIIGILGEDPFHAALDEAVVGEKVKDHPIIVQRYHDVKDITTCHILFINLKEESKMKETLSILSGKNILTVSDMPDFAAIGGIVRFASEKNKIRLQINLPASKHADLTISSKLLQVADIVR
ncbi:MAG TPA: YfiR family protein [Segetibacter sp.]|nr:YfiR family protein [Segetibacter sp.]